MNNKHQIEMTNDRINASKVLRRLALPCALALAANLLVGWPLMARADQAPDPTKVQCQLQPNSLHFGRVTLHRVPLLQGEGEALVSCHNPSQQAALIEITLAFPTMGPQPAVLQSSHDALGVSFFLDAQFSEYWGDGTNGAQALHMAVKLGPGEARVLRLPVHALLHNRRDARAGAYMVNLPIQLTTLTK